MRYKPGHKAISRMRIINGARLAFAEQGYEQATIDDIMARADLTRGGFYSHFNSKEDVFVEAIMTGIVEKIHAPWAPYRESTTNEFEAMVASYVGDEHFCDHMTSCPLITFPSDVARGGERLREAYEQVAKSIAATLECEIKGRDAQQRSLATLAMIVGSMVVARSVKSPSFERAIRSACVKYAAELNN